VTKRFYSHTHTYICTSLYAHTYITTRTRITNKLCGAPALQSNTFFFFWSVSERATFIAQSPDLVSRAEVEGRYKVLEISLARLPYTHTCHIHIHAHIHACTHIQAHTHIHTYTCIGFAYIQTPPLSLCFLVSSSFLSLRTHSWTQLRADAYIHTNLHAHTYKHTFIHTYIHTQRTTQTQTRA